MWWVQTLWDARIGPGQTLLISHFQLRLQICRFVQVTWRSAELSGGCDSAVTGLKMSEHGCYFWYLNYFPTQVTARLKLTEAVCLPFIMQAERHISVLRGNLKWVLRTFPNSAIHRDNGVQDGRKCVGWPLPCYWMLVSTDMLFLQDPLGSCKGNDSVICSSSSLLELCDSISGHQRILVIISEQQFPLRYVFVQMPLNYAPECNNSTFSAKENAYKTQL